MIRTSSRILTLAAAASALLVVGTPVFAQGTSLFGSLGPTSQGSQGGIRSNTGSSSGFGTASPFNSSFGNTSTTGSQFGSSAFGNNSLGGTQSSTLQAYSQARTSNLGGAQGQGQQGLGANGMNGQLQSFGRTGANRFGQQGFGLGQNGRNGQGLQQLDQQQTSPAAQQQVRIRPQVSFPFQTRPTAAVHSSLNLSFNRITNRGPDFANIQFSANGQGQVTLRGSVPNEQAARVAAALVRLEPGVRSVRNEMSVTTSSVAPATTSLTGPAIPTTPPVTPPATPLVPPPTIPSTTPANPQ